MTYPFQNCIDHAQHVDSSTLLPVIVDGSHGAIPLSNLEKLRSEERIFGLLELSGNLALNSEMLTIASSWVPAQSAAAKTGNITNGLMIIGGLLNAGGILKVDAAKWKENCRLTDNWDWETHPDTAVLPTYPRAIRGFFGFAYFATNLIPYYKKDGEIHVVLAVSSKKSSDGRVEEKYDLIGGNIPFNKHANESMAIEAGEETTGKLILDPDLYCPDFKTQAYVIANSLRMTKVQGDKVLNGNRRIYKLAVPEGAEKDWIPQGGEVQSFRALSLGGLLNVWHSGDEKHEFALKRFKHNVPMSLVALGLSEKIIRPNAILSAALARNYIFPATARVAVRKPMVHLLGKPARDIG